MLGLPIVETPKTRSRTIALPGDVCFTTQFRGTSATGSNANRASQYFSLAGAFHVYGLSPTRLPR